MAGDRSVQIGGDAVANVVNTGDDVAIEARVTGTKHEAPRGEGAASVAEELAAIRALLTSLDGEHAKKIGRALDDANEELDKKTPESKDELGVALDRALRLAKSTTAFAGSVAKLAPHVKNVVAWLGEKWTALLTYVT